MQKILISRLQGSFKTLVQNIINGANTAINVTLDNTGNINFAVKVDNSTIKINNSNELYAVPQTSYLSAQADEIIKQGQPVYIKNNGHIGLAKASALLTSKVVGFAIADTSIGFSCEYTENNLTLSNWPAITGTSYLIVGDVPDISLLTDFGLLTEGISSLSINNYYYLSPDIAGNITNIAPTSTGQYVVSIGEAVSTTTLEIEIEKPILL